MAFANQFALSVELTRLLPVQWATNKATDVLMKFARHLKNSGSDIVAEEDLAMVFGRCKISDQLSTSFKTVVAQSSSNTSLWESITLQSGPGPTVLRAFQDSPYFAMVVQLSFLAWAFDVKALTTALTDALRRRTEGAPSSAILQSSPSRSAVADVLTACESQTSAFNWNMMLNAVSALIGDPAYSMKTEFPPFILQALLDMFPLVQSLPNDRFIHVQLPGSQSPYGHAGPCALVVWAHHILGLTVVVRVKQDSGQAESDTHFGDSGWEQLLIEVIGDDEEASIILLDSSGEHLLAVKQDPDEEQALIGSVTRYPAKGWGNQLLRDLSWSLNEDAIIQELQIFTIAIAFIITRNLIKCYPQNVCKVDERRLLQASQFLFDNNRLVLCEIDSYITRYANQPLNLTLQTPPAFEAGPQDDASRGSWPKALALAKNLSIFLIALANVVNLDKCGDLMINGVAFDEMSFHPLAQQLNDWDGKKPLQIGDDCWLLAISIPLFGHKLEMRSLPLDKVCLISEGAWSAWITTLETIDPAYISPGSVQIGRGRPCRNGVWKSGIWDGVDSQPLQSANDRIEACGQIASLRCLDEITFENPYCGEADMAFILSARFRDSTSTRKYQYPLRPKVSSFRRRIGYRELQRSLWFAIIADGCSHVGRSDEAIKLSPGCVTVSGLLSTTRHLDEPIIICLTAHNVGARWMALNDLPDSGVYSRHILLRPNDCCFQCVVDQAIMRSGKWFIIL